MQQAATARHIWILGDFMRSTLITSAAALALSALAAPAIAQPVEITPAGAELRVFTGGGDGAGEVVELPLTIDEDEGIFVEVLPADGNDWDPRIDAVDGNGNTLAEDDDSGGGLGSRLLLLGADATQVTVRVMIFGGGEEEGEDGNVQPFLLTVRTTDRRPPTPIDLALGADATGMVEDSGSALYRISGSAGEAISIAVDAADGEWDPQVEIFAGGNARRLNDPLARDDDGGDELNSLLYFVFEDEGDYLIRVSPVGAAGGDFTIRTARAEGLTPSGDQPALALGEERTLVLVNSQGVGGPLVPLGEDIRAAIARGDTKFAFTLLPEDADSGTDPLVAVGFDTPLGFSELRSDDDGAASEEGGLGSRLVLDLAPFVEDGSQWLDLLRIRPRVISSGVGRAVLSVETTDDDETTTAVNDTTSVVALEAVAEAAE